MKDLSPEDPSSHQNASDATSTDRNTTRAASNGALLLGLSCYLIWGFFPLYFRLLQPAGALEVIVHRAVWGLLFCLILLALRRQFGRLVATLRDRQVVARLSLAGVLIVINWTTYVYAVQSGHTVDAALGYFINPLVTVALGMLVLRERISRLQAVAVGLGLIAVAVLVLGAGRLPWVSLVLALSFALYSLVKKKIATRVGPLEGMAVETAAVTPILLGYYLWLVAHNSTSFNALSQGEGSINWGWHLVLLIGAGFLTMVPLLMFAKAARGLPLGVIGLLQYVTPVMQLLIGILVFHETMEPARWAGTAIVWLALMVLSADWLLQARRLRRLTQVAS